MKTVMQRWHDVKISLEVSLNVLANSYSEAAEIVAHKCGQKIGKLEIQLGHHEVWLAGRYVKVLFKGQDATDKLDFEVDVEMSARHLNGTLKEWEALARLLETFNTGKILSVWEEQQAKE